MNTVRWSNQIIVSDDDLRTSCKFLDGVVSYGFLPEFNQIGPY